MLKRLPNWLKVKRNLGDIRQMKSLLRSGKLHTVCEEAHCPNIGECFGKGTATFMIMGDTCTRNCSFCAIKNGVPSNLDSNEPTEIANAVKNLSLKHVVITSVTRDDLPDEGATHFKKTIEAIKNLSDQTTIEVLVPDFGGNESHLKIVTDAKPHVFNHNVETVPSLTPQIRDKRANYETSKRILNIASKLLPDSVIKSGIMLGLGETDAEVLNVIKDLKNIGVHAITIGQYLPPSKTSYEVKRFVAPSEFQKWEERGDELGVKIFAGPLVRSSYFAKELLNIVKNGDNS